MTKERYAEVSAIIAKEYHARASKGHRARISHIFAGRIAFLPDDKLSSVSEMIKVPIEELKVYKELRKERWEKIHEILENLLKNNGAIPLKGGRNLKLGERMDILKETVDFEKLLTLLPEEMKIDIYELFFFWLNRRKIGSALDF